MTVSCSLSNGWTPGKCPCAPLSILFKLGRLSCSGRRTMMGKFRGSPYPGPQQWLSTTNTWGVWIPLTRRWPMTFFQHLLDIAVTNNYIVHKELSKAQQQKAMTRQAFQEELSAHLLGVPLTGPPCPPAQSHFPIPTNKNECTDKRQKTALGRKKCTLCHKSTPWMCDVCLCLQVDRNCFRDYHC